MVLKCMFVKKLLYVHACKDTGIFSHASSDYMDEILAIIYTAKLKYIVYVYIVYVYIVYVYIPYIIHHIAKKKYYQLHLYKGSVYIYV